jgi:hypothetical protein
LTGPNIPYLKKLLFFISIYYTLEACRPKIKKIPPGLSFKMAPKNGTFDTLDLRSLPDR